MLQTVILKTLTQLPPKSIHIKSITDSIFYLNVIQVPGVVLVLCAAYCQVCLVLILVVIWGLMTKSL